MGVHHLAFAAKDMDATHRFYSGAMGFELVKVEVGRIGGGWAKHVFYSTGSPRDQLIAFWDLHDDSLPPDWSADISRGLGLAPAVNHLAFTAVDRDDLARHRDRWLAHGHDVLEVDHDWCVSIYTEDPNGTVVEFCTLVRDFTEADRKEAARLLADPQPAPSGGPKDRVVYKAADYRPAGADT